MMFLPLQKILDLSNCSDFLALEVVLIAEGNFVLGYFSLRNMSFLAFFFRLISYFFVRIALFIVFFLCVYYESLHSTLTVGIPSMSLKSVLRSMIRASFRLVALICPFSSGVWWRESVS